MKTAERGWDSRRAVLRPQADHRAHDSEEDAPPMLSCGCERPGGDDPTADLAGLTALQFVHVTSVPFASHRRDDSRPKPRRAPVGASITVAGIAARKVN